MEKNTLRIALAGNPNSGKTTLFNAITGAHHQVGNYPGVTVEKREGTRKWNGYNYHFIDLPGIYSLTAYSEDEVVARDFILDDKPDLIVDVLDSTNLERNLYLCLQMQELGIPIVGALNMSDEAKNLGIQIDYNKLSAAFGIDFVEITASKGRGIDKLLNTIETVYSKAQNGKIESKTLNYGADIEAWLKKIEDLIIEGQNAKTPASGWPELSGVSGASDGARKDQFQGEARFLAAKLLEKDKAAAARLGANPNNKAILKAAQEGIDWIEKHYGKDAEIVISERRYAYIHSIVKGLVNNKKTASPVTEAIDKVIMNRFLALPIFIGILWLVFQLTFTIGAYPQDWLQSFFDFAGSFLNNHMAEGPLRSMLVDGIIAGVGSVFSFVPLIVLLFFFLSILEDVGYMSRAAFATDKLLHSFGLHGQSVFPLMLGFGCSVPAIMSSRTLKSPRDRIVTVLVTPMMSCGAKLTIYVLFTAAFFPNNAANMVMLIYACGVVIGLASSALLKATVLKGDPTPLVMELPPYRMPTLGGALWHVWEKLGSYVKKAGTIILACSILIWLMTNYPDHELSGSQIEQLRTSYMAQNSGAGDDEVNGYIEIAQADARLEHSVAGTMGRFIEPFFKPLGFNWKMSIAAITGFAAKEVVVSTLGILYHVGMDEEGDSTKLQEAVREDIHPLNGFTFMLFMLLIPPCIAALSVIKAELGWKWLGFEIVFLLLTGWIVSFIVFQLGSLIIG
ncbi:MAG: ferrous iron transport protein B [Spirochaetaceae bacterium]|jgi:ferrous iron transport protein B|nr:ferrous iron transport protein B [Spirochaetaceae bacterium]